MPAAPIYVNPQKVWQTAIPEKQIEVLNGSFDIQRIERSITKHKYILNVKEDSLIKENTYYFPGWELIVDNKLRKIDFTNTTYPGIIVFPLEKGIHEVSLIFSDTPVRRFSLLTSLISLFITGFGLLICLPTTTTASAESTTRPT